MDKQGFDYKDFNLVPKKCIVGSRSECKTETILNKHHFKSPITPANMECVIDIDLAIKLASNGYFYIMHRYIPDIYGFCVQMASKNLPVSISIGVNDDSYEILNTLIGDKIKVDFITVDIAHGDSVKMQKMLTFIKTNWKNTAMPYIIAGNICTPDAALDLVIWGADCIKIGIGPGSACSTYNATGFGSRHIQASCVQMCKKILKNNSHVKIIADGGIKDAGDVAKALVMGADMVMIGGMLSGLRDSPGNLVYGENGKIFKEFWGSASVHAQGGTKQNRIEGIKQLVPMEQEFMLDKMHYLVECLQSAISYGGGTDISSMVKNADIIFHHGC